MRIDAVRGPIAVVAMLAAVLVPLMTSSNAALGVSARSSASPSGAGTGSGAGAGAGAASPSPSVSKRPSVSKSPSVSKPPSASKSPSASASPSPDIAGLGSFYRSVLDVRSDMPGISEQQFYYIGQAFCTNASLSQDQFIGIQQAYAMPAATLAYDSSISTAMVEAAPMDFIEENQSVFGFSASDLDRSTLNAFRMKLCQDHQIWLSYAHFVYEQLLSLGPWQTDPTYSDPTVAARFWSNDLSAWESALGPWLPSQLQAS